MNICLVSPWNAICGVSSMARFLVEALEKRGHTFTIITNKYAGEYYPTGEVDALNVHRVFETGFQADNSLHQIPEVEQEEIGLLVSEKKDLLIINYQDFLFPDKQFLNRMIAKFKRRGKKVLLLIHDSCLSTYLDSYQVDAIICPPSITAFRTFKNLVYIDQGIPEFNFENGGGDGPTATTTSPELKAEVDGIVAHESGVHNDDSREQEGNNLPVLNQRWRIVSFGLGRNKNRELIDLVSDINYKNLLQKPLDLEICVSKPNQYDEYANHSGAERCAFLNTGYKTSEQLAHILHRSHACVIWYPEIHGQSTSSAFRFAIGAQVPIIANRSNWLRDQIGNGCWIEVETKEDPITDKQNFRNAIVSFFLGLFSDTYSQKREKMTILQQNKIKEAGWSKIAEQYEQLF